MNNKLYINFDYFRMLADTYESFQMTRIEAQNRMRAMFQGYDENDSRRKIVLNSVAMIELEEEHLKTAMLKELRTIPIWTEFFNHVKGIGPTLACKILALNLDLRRNLTSWNAYFGLVPTYWKATCEKKHWMLYPKEPARCNYVDKKKKDREVCGNPIKEKEFIAGAPRRTKGILSFWNPRARKLSWLIGKSFIKQKNSFYRKQYDSFKAREQTVRAGLTKLQIDRSASRKTVQLFLAHMYQAMHELSGSKARIPYQFEYLSHSHFVDWKDVVEYDRKK